jgi:hypothetical protein
MPGIPEYARQLYFAGGIPMKKMQFRRRPITIMSAAIRKSRGIIGKLKRAWLFASVSISAALLMTTPAYAAAAGGTDIWGWLDTALNDLYQKFLSVSTIAACVAASVCLIMMNFSTDDRAVSTSRAWLKRILISWVILNVLGFIMVYLTGLTQGGSYVPPGTP